jgi:hypothetical protein
MFSELPPDSRHCGKHRQSFPSQDAQSATGRLRDMRRELRQSSRTRSRFCPECRRRWPCLVPAAAKSGASSAASVKSAGKGQSNPALASRFKVSRTVDGATPTRRAISLSSTPAVFKRGTSRTWRIVVLSAGIRSPVQKPKERTLFGPAEAPPTWATSSRNGGRNHPGTPSELKSEWWARSSRIRGRVPPESALRSMSLSTYRSTRFSEPSFLREYGRCRAPRRSAGRPRSKRAAR